MKNKLSGNEENMIIQKVLDYCVSNILTLSGFPHAIDNYLF